MSSSSRLYNELEAHICTITHAWKGGGSSRSNDTDIGGGGAIDPQLEAARGMEVARGAWIGTVEALRVSKQTIVSLNVTYSSQFVLSREGTTGAGRNGAGGRRW